MRNRQTLAIGFAVVLAVDVFGRSTWAQAPATDDKINPPVTNCNITKDFVAVSNPNDAARPTIKAQPVTPALLKSGQPCHQVANDKSGLFGANGLANLQHAFDFYSWLTFVALNSPADGKIIGKGGRAGGDAQTMWESLKNSRPLADVMLPDGSKPTWGTRNVPTLCKKLDGPGKIVLQIGEASWNQPFKTGPLIDQSGNYALFDILMNKPMFDFIVQNGLYSRQGQERFDNDIIFPSGENPKDATPGKMGAVMVKVSWRILDAAKDKDLMSKFHTADGLIFFPGPPATKAGPACVEKKLGLIGFHVGHKTLFAPQWAWTSFEHVSNVPDEADVAAGNLLDRYSFFNKDCKECSRNETPPDPWDPPTSLKFHSEHRSQVVRTKILPGPVVSEVQDLNRDFRAVLKGTVWENYELLTTQWPSDHASKTDCNGAPAPTYLANTTLETYSQGRVPLASSSCMSCHGNATTQHVPATPSDFTFILEKAQCENGKCGPPPTGQQSAKSNRQCGFASTAPR